MVKGHQKQQNKKAPVPTPRRQNRVPRNWAGAQMQPSERTVWNRKVLSLGLSQALVEADTQAPANETKYLNASESWSLSDFFDTTPGANSYLSTVDQYRFDRVEVYIEISNMPFNNFFRRFNVWYKPDYDDNNVVDWTNLQRRTDVQFKWMNPVDKPRVHLMTLLPRGNFRNSITGSDPSNVIPGPNTWFDIAAPDQNFVGLKLHVEVNSGTGETFIPRVMVTSKARIMFRGQI